MEKLSELGVILKRGPLPKGVLYRWAPPYLIVCTDASPCQITKAIEHFMKILLNERGDQPNALSKMQERHTR